MIKTRERKHGSGSCGVEAGPQQQREGWAGGTATDGQDSAVNLGPHPGAGGQGPGAKPWGGRASPGDSAIEAVPLSPHSGCRLPGVQEQICGVEGFQPVIHHSRRVLTELSSHARSRALSRESSGGGPGVCPGLTRSSPELCSLLARFPVFF